MQAAPKICFDRILPQDMNEPAFEAPHSSLEAVVVVGKLWPNGSTLRIRFMEGPAEQRQLAMEQAAWWAQHANLRFVESDDLDSEIRITFDANDGAWSYVGTDCRNIPQDQATMNLGFQDGGTSAHEFGHAIGFAHEHQNPQGGIVWNEPEVLRDLSGPPNFWTPQQIRHNVLRKYERDQIRGTTFDPDSVMLYAFPARWTQNGIATRANEALSRMDAEFAAQVYPRGGDDGVVPLEVNGAKTTGRIGQPGEEDLYSFVVDRPGRHVIETGGQTDVVMKLFGPDSQTALVGEDDDSGAGFNARISKRLTRGEYLVQIRHYNRQAGAGDYTVSVRR